MTLSSKALLWTAYCPKELWPCVSGLFKCANLTRTACSTQNRWPGFWCVVWSLQRYFSFGQHLSCRSSGGLISYAHLLFVILSIWQSSAPFLIVLRLMFQRNRFIVYARCRNWAIVDVSIVKSWSCSDKDQTGSCSSSYGPAMCLPS